MGADGPLFQVGQGFDDFGEPELRLPLVEQPPCRGEHLRVDRNFVAGQERSLPSLSSLRVILHVWVVGHRPVTRTRNVEPALAGRAAEAQARRTRCDLQAPRSVAVRRGSHRWKRRVRTAGILAGACARSTQRAEPNGATAGAPALRGRGWLPRAFQHGMRSTTSRRSSPTRTRSCSGRSGKRSSSPRRSPSSTRGFCSLVPRVGSHDAHLATSLKIKHFLSRARC